VASGGGSVTWLARRCAFETPVRTLHGVAKNVANHCFVRLV
jgi:hypothetical protein